jgi:hypothetical protein
MKRMDFNGISTEANSSFSPRLHSFLYFFLPLSVLVTIITLLPFYFDYSRRLKTINIEELHHVERMNEIVLSGVGHIVTDLRVLSETGNYLDFLLNNDARRQREIERLLLIFSVNKGIYDQVRILDQNGQEVARVDYNIGVPKVVPAVELQNKKKRYYFADSMSLERGETYISPMDLNIEQGDIELPFKPVLRFVTPIIDEQGNKRGLVVLNYLAGGLLKDLMSVYDRSDGIPMLLNREGFG